MITRLRSNDVEPLLEVGVSPRARARRRRCSPPSLGHRERVAARRPDQELLWYQQEAVWDVQQDEQVRWHARYICHALEEHLWWEVPGDHLARVLCSGSLHVSPGGKWDTAAARRTSPTGDQNSVGASLLKSYVAKAY